MTKKHSGGASSKMAIGAGLVALAAAAAGSYFIYGEGAAKRRAQVRGWALKAKGDVLQGIEKLPSINEKNYQALVNKVTARYKNVKQASPAEAAALARELKGHWKSIHKQLVSAGASIAKSARRIGSKAAPKKRSTRRR